MVREENFSEEWGATWHLDCLVCLSVCLSVHLQIAKTEFIVSKNFIRCREARTLVGLMQNSCCCNWVGRRFRRQIYCSIKDDHSVNIYNTSPSLLATYTVKMLVSIRDEHTGGPGGSNKNTVRTCLLSMSETNKKIFLTEREREGTSAQWYSLNIFHT